MKVNYRGRFWLIRLIIAAAMTILLVQLANLQIRNTEVYGESAESKRTKVIPLRGDRGQILDASGTVLAYDKKIYNIEFYGEPSASDTRKAKYTKSIWEVIQVLEKSGKELLTSFWLQFDETDGLWKFEFGNITESAAAAREKMWRSNFYLRTTDTQELYNRLITIYGLDKLDTEDYTLTREDHVKILSVWQEMQMNAFLSKSIRIASDVDWATAIEIETRLINLDGMTVTVSNQRVYPYGTVACHVLGYIGKMQSASAIETYTARGYAMDDMVGLDGIEKSMEDTLSANILQRQGQRMVEVDRSGKIVRELAYTPAQSGNSVKLTLRMDLQRVAETALKSVINDIRNTEEKEIKDPAWLERNREKLLVRNFETLPLRLADKGAIVVLDMQARVLAMASYPDFDPNLFILGMDSAQYDRMMMDTRNPLFNNAIGSRDTPGSIFKMTTALAALVEGAITVDDMISDEGVFYKYDDTNAPKCWASNATRLARHQNQTIIQGLQNSCNFFFYTITDRLGENGAGGEIVHRYAAKLGLTSKTNIDLPGEARSIVANQNSLYDPSRAITEADQDISRPYLVKLAIKKHLRRVGEVRNITYSDERLDRAIKGLMDMALVTPQSQWVRSIRPILMEELGMTLEMAMLSEVVSDIYNYLNEITWGGSESIMAAIGQSITQTTPLAIARYVVALANGGMVYDVSIVDSITSPEGEVVKSLQSPAVFADLTEEFAPYIYYIHEGMKGVVDESGTAGRYFDDWDYKDQIAGKTGTAQKSTLDVENNAWFVSFAPYDEPEIVVVVYVPAGMAAGYVTRAARDVIGYYLDSKQDAVVVEPAAPNSLAQ